MNLWIRIVLVVAAVFPIHAFKYVDEHYYVATEAKFKNGGYYDSNGRYYKRTEPYYTIFGELVSSGGKHDPNGTYIPTEDEYYNGGYYINDYTIYIPTGSYNATGYFTPKDTWYHNGGHWYFDSNGVYYPKLSEPYTNTFGEWITNGGNVYPNGTYIPTEDEYNYGGYYMNHFEWNRYIPYGSYNSTGYFTPKDTWYHNGSHWYYDSNGVYYPRLSEPYTTTFGEWITNGGNIDPNGTYIPTKDEYNNGGYHIDHFDYNRYVPTGSYNATGYFTPMYYQYGDYYDSNGVYYPYNHDDSYHDTYEPKPYPYPVRTETVNYTYEEAYAYPVGTETVNYTYEEIPEAYTDDYISIGIYPEPYTEEPKYYDCDGGYYNTYGWYVCGGGTWSYGSYIPTETEYKYGGYENSMGYYIPRGYYTSSGYNGSEDSSQGGSQDGMEYDGGYEPYGPYEYDHNDWHYDSHDDYEKPHYDSHDYYEEPHYDSDGHYEVPHYDIEPYEYIEYGACGQVNTAQSEFHQSYEMCFHNADRFEDRAKGYLEQLEKEVRENPKCKYIPALIDGNDENVAQEFKDLFDQLQYLDDPVDFLKWLENVPEQSYLNVCAEIAEFQSCIIDGLLPIISEVMDMLENDECCTAFMDNIAIEEYSMVERIAMQVNQIPNLFCLNRIPDEIVREEQNCGYTIVQSMFPPVIDEIVTNLKAVVQIPNDEACKAFNGDVYTDTTGNRNYLTINLPIGSCSSALDTVFSTVKAFLIDDGENSLHDFAIDIGLISRELLDDIENEIGSLKALFDDESCSNIELPEGLGEICLNFPTEFTRECYPELAAKGIYGGPMLGLFASSTKAVEPSSDPLPIENAGNAHQSMSIAVTLVTAVSMMFINTL